MTRITMSPRSPSWRGGATCRTRVVSTTSMACLASSQPSPPSSQQVLPLPSWLLTRSTTTPGKLKSACHDCCMWFMLLSTSLFVPACIWCFRHELRPMLVTSPLSSWSLVWRLGLGVPQEHRPPTSLCCCCPPWGWPLLGDLSLVSV